MSSGIRGTSGTSGVGILKDGVLLPREDGLLVSGVRDRCSGVLVRKTVVHDAADSRCLPPLVCSNTSELFCLEALLEVEGLMAVRILFRYFPIPPFSGVPDPAPWFGSTSMGSGVVSRHH